MYVTGFSIQPFEHAGHAHPQVALVIFIQTVHQGFAEVGGGIGLRRQQLEPRLPSGKQVGLGGPETGPDVAAAVFIQTSDAILGEALRIFRAGCGIGPRSGCCVSSFNRPSDRVPTHRVPCVILDHGDGPGQWTAGMFLVVEGVAGELMGVAIEAGDAVARCVQHPERAVAILVEGQVAGLGNGDAQQDLAGFRVELLEPAVVRDPEVAATIGARELDVVVGETGGVRRVVPEAGGFAGGGVERIQP